MKSSKIDRIVSVVVIGTCLIKAVLYGGSKPPSTTNEPPSDISGDALTNPPPMMCFSPRPMMSPPPEQTENEPSATYHSSLIPQTSWNTRGAYCDWLRVTFPDGFAFPSGTNLLTGVTVMAYGEIRESLHQLTTNNQQLTTLPMAVSIEPDNSSVSYGLTPSNSYLFTWQNVCVNRSPTNRVDASIELFRNGDLAITVTPLSSPSTSTFAYQPAVPPAGFVGSGQDTNWLASVFAPTDYTQITNKGYGAWLSEDYVGVNEQNGHYRADITVASLPDNGVPCYLVCGPYNVVVNQPGTYSFPLEVFKSYRVRTYPVALPLTISTDDGYRAPLLSASSPSPVLTASRPRLALSAPSPDTPPEYEICETPRLVLSPTEIPLDQAVGTHVSIWCNVASTARRYYAWFSREFKLNFCNPSDAEIVAAEVEDLVEIIIDAPLGTCAGTIRITDNDLCCGCGSCTDSNCTCGCDCWRHSQSNDTPTNSPSATP